MAYLQLPPIPSSKPAPVLPQRDGCADWLYYNTDHWPVVVVEGRHTDTPDSEMRSRFEAHLHCFTTCLNYNAPFAIVFDIRNCNKFPWGYIKAMAEFLNVMKGKIEENLLCSSIICDSMLVRGVIQAVFAIHPPTRPCRTTHEPHVSRDFVVKHFSDNYDHAIDSVTGLSGNFTAEQEEEMRRGRALLEGVDV